MKLLVELLTSTAKRNPEQIALDDGDQKVSYLELLKMARMISSALRQKGVKPGDRVGLLMTKSIRSIAALYGIMLTGAAYVPFDVASPLSRVQYMIENCDLNVLMVDSEQLKRLRQSDSPPSVSYFLLDQEQSEGIPADLETCDSVTYWDEISNESQSIAENDHYGQESDLAYILYTSGSTGEPKGVCLSHRNAMAFVEWAAENVNAVEGDRFASYTPMHFDLSTFDLFVACKVGATVFLVPESLKYFPAALAKWIESNQISIWYSVPSALTAMMNSGRMDRFTFPDLRAILFAGEVFPSRYLSQWISKVPHARFLNYFGPTETNVCTYFEVTKPPEDDHPIPIGKAASRNKVWLISDEGEAIERPGEVGEIWIDGPSVAVGYFADEAKTFARFVKRPDLTGHNQALCRTGDLAEYDAQGDLIFHGRRDHMVKTRGYRIELGEIEAAFQANPRVEETCAVAKPCSENGSRIIAFVVINDPRMGAEELSKQIADRLPHYMLPHEINILDQLPKNSRGKIDRQLLLEHARAGELEGFSDLRTSNASRS